jgi:RimJ/RimL family protein N-acetyltransferase
MGLWKADNVDVPYATRLAELETARLRLAPLDSSRAEELAEIYANPEVARYIGGDRLTGKGTRAQVALFEQVWRARGHGQSAIIERTTGPMIGRAGLYHWANWDEVELGYVLATDSQGQGMAREAAQAWLQRAQAHLPQDDLIAVIQPANTASIALAELLGFTFERRDVEVSIYRLHRSAG